MYVCVRPSNMRFTFRAHIPSFLLGRKYGYFSLGRLAFQSLVKILRIRRGDNILLPAYICDVAIPPFENQGVEVRYFDIKSDLTPNLEMVKSLIDCRTKALLIVHYFGFPQPILDIRVFCQKNKLLLIEDCAHVLGTQCNGKYLGTFGEAAVFSPRKLLSMVDGGILSVDPKYELASAGRETCGLKLKPVVHLFLQHLCFKLGTRLPLDIVYRLTRHESEGRQNQEWQEDYGKMSPFSKWVLLRSHYAKVGAKRRKNYEYLRGLLEGMSSVKLLFKELPEAIVPMALPILLEPRFVEQLLPYAGKYGFYLWPYLPDFRKSKLEYGQALYFSKRLVLLPIHQDIKPRHLKALVRLLKKIHEAKKPRLGMDRGE